MRSEIEDLIAARKRAGFSQRELASRTGMHQPNIAAIESGRTIPTRQTVDRLRAACAQKPSEALAERRDQVRQIITAAGGLNPRIFGSVARGSDTSESDLDLLVDLGGMGAFAVTRLSRKLAEILGVPVDIVDDFGATRTLENARRDAILL